MSFDWALLPISGEDPCGPNLDASDDADFVEYYYDALGKIPDRYVKPGMETEGGRRTTDEVFDPRSIKIQDEIARIKPMLEKSRDVRLLTLWAQFECLVGRPEPLADVLETIADLIETYGDAVHPAIDGDAGERRDALNELAQPVSMQMGLRYMGLMGTTDVTLRKLQVADKKSVANSTETNINGSVLRDALGSADYRQKVDAVHSALMRMTDALNRIQRACRMSDTVSFNPGLDPTLSILAEMREAITRARPDLRGAEADLQAEPAPDPVPDTSSAADLRPLSAPSAGAAPLPPTAVKTQSQARQVLVACETYFQTHEPSSAALLLVRQARMLIGKPLIYALEALLPEDCAKAMVSFGPQTGFALPAQRLKALSEDALTLTVVPDDDDATAEPVLITNSADVAAAIRGVEDFFRIREKSSPVPILLQRARSYQDKDFQALVDELIPRPPQK